MANITIVGGGEYDTLSAAVSCVQDGGTILVNNDISGAGVATFGSAANGILTKSFTIDFQGNTFTCIGPAVGSRGTQSQAFHLECSADVNYTPVNITLKNGTICTTTTSGVKMLVQNYDNLTLENMTLDGTNLNTTSAYTWSNNNGSSTATNTTIIANEGGRAFDVCGYSVYPAASVATTACQISGNVEVTYSAAKRDHDISLTLNTGTVVTGSLVGDRKLTKEQISSNVTITKAAGVALAVDTTSFGDYAFDDSGKVIDGETKRKQDEEKAKAAAVAGAAYAQQMYEYQQRVTYIQRQRLLQQQQYMVRNNKQH